VKILIKIGGTLLDVPESRERIAREITEARQRSGYRIVVVHGGGKQMTRFLAERGIESRFINGLRVTSPEIIDAVVKVFAGTVNAQLVTAFRKAGARPVGLSGISAGLVDAVQLNEELGQVGLPVSSDARVLDLLTGESYIPIIACVAGDPTGRIFNVNADQMAVACAVSFQAESLFFLTDVDGVRDLSGQIRPSLSAAEATGLIDGGVATGGMQAKLESALSALNRGVKRVTIAPGARAGVVEELFRGERIGTNIVLS
jgi:acetylglutamate kinase